MVHSKITTVDNAFCVTSVTASPGGRGKEMYRERGVIKMSLSKNGDNGDRGLKYLWAQQVACHRKVVTKWRHKMQWQMTKQN